MILLVAPGVLACDGRDITPVEVRTATFTVPAPGDAACLELGAHQVCYDASTDCPAPPCVFDKRLPEVPALSAMGFRCTRHGDGRRCTDRLRLAGAFSCQGDRCRQRHPRVPDDGEWTCSDQAGAVVCTGGVTPAGVPAAARAPGWFCGERNGREERICVDFDPDFPDGAASRWTCRFDHEAGTARVCERSEQRAVLGAHCSPESPCVDGADCVRGACIPKRPDPACWIDGDCPRGVCRFGSCLERTP